MPMKPTGESTLIPAFFHDGWEVTPDNDIFRYNGRLGIRARHQTAVNYDTKEPKKAYYVEGTHYEMGYLLGLMAEPEISRMANDFVDKIVPDFIAPKMPECLKKILGKVVVEVVEGLVTRAKQDFPAQYSSEISGILDGCRNAKTFTGVQKDELWVLNMGIDCVQAALYGMKFLRDQIAGLLMPELEDWMRAHPSLDERIHRIDRPFELQPDFFQMPILCNSLSVFGDSAGGGHYFGRDFMFPNARVFQDVATLIIYNPDYPGAHPFVSHTAPGIVGTVAGMSLVEGTRGIGVGTNLVAAPNCDADRPGFNGLSLMRHCLQTRKSAAGIVDEVERTRRGVAYIYPVSDGVTDAACVIEAGATMDPIPFLDYPKHDDHPDLKIFLPDQAFLANHETADQLDGIMVRWADYDGKGHLSTYVNTFDRDLFIKFDRRFDAGMLGLKGEINKCWKDHNCPYSYFFAPQRETRSGVVLATNFFVIPEMRLCSMDEWTTAIAMQNNFINDFQWRYDTLNRMTMERLGQGALGFDGVQDLIDFLRPKCAPGSPYQQVPFDEYHDRPTSDDGREIMISGSVSVMDLKNCVIRSHFGYYCDEWVTISLPRYFA